MACDNAHQRGEAPIAGERDHLPAGKVAWARIPCAAAFAIEPCQLPRHGDGAAAARALAGHLRA